jgi:hypothetical protein
MIPEDKTIKKVLDLSYGDPSEKQQAYSIIAASIALEAYKTPTDFKAAAGKASNALHYYLKIDASGSSANSVKFESGATASLDKKFVDGSKKGQLAVYSLTGELPTEGELVPLSKPSASSRKKKITTGGQDEEEEAQESYYGGHEGLQLRNKIADEVEVAYIQARQNAEKQTFNVLSKAKVGGKRPTIVEGQTIKNPYLEAVLSLINYIFHFTDEECVRTILLGRIFPILSYCHIDFYLIFEPHKASGECLVPDHIIESWYKRQPAFNINIVLDKVEKHINGQDKNPSCPGFYVKRYELLDEVDSLRDNALVNLGRSMSQDIINIYLQLANENRIGHIRDILPQELASLYAKEPYRKICEDELRFNAYLHFKRIEENPVFELAAFNSIREKIADHLALPNTQNKLGLLNPNANISVISPTSRTERIKIFVNSIYFLYLHMTDKVCAKLKDDYITSSSLQNADASIWVGGMEAKHKAVILGGGQGNQIDDAINTLQGLKDIVDEEVKKKIQDLEMSLKSAQ